MLLVVLLVFFEVALGDLTNKTDKIFKFDASGIKKLVLLEDLVGHELQRVVVENCFGVEHIKSSHVHFSKAISRCFCSMSARSPIYKNSASIFSSASNYC